MVEIIPIIGRTILLYILIIIFFRLMGKRELGELSILDLVVFLMFAELAAIAIENTDESIWNTVLPMVTLLIIQISFAIISLHSQRFREKVDGKPSILIENGKIDEAEMRKQRYNFDDLLVQLRQKDIRSVGDVEFAILEPSGKLSVFEKSDYTDDHKSVIPLPLVIDGLIQKDHLRRIHQTEAWLLKHLKELGYKEVKKISYCGLNNRGNFFVDIKDEKK